MSVRAATLDDIEQLRSIASESWWATYRGIFDDAFIEDFLARAYAPPFLARCIGDPAHVFLLFPDAGFAHFGARSGEGWELLRIYARPSRFDSGVGRALLAEGERVLRERGVSSYFCKVHEKNARGLRFYARRGFVRDLAGDDDEGHQRWVRTLTA
jgi:GNAT superfamily N-acetyltransferase